MLGSALLSPAFLLSSGWELEHLYTFVTFGSEELPGAKVDMGMV